MFYFQKIYLNNYRSNKKQNYKSHLEEERKKKKKSHQQPQMDVLVAEDLNWLRWLKYFSVIGE